MSASIQSAPQKRKQPPAAANSSVSIGRSAKRVRTSNARTILAQHPEKALKKNGELDVSAFVKAREFEIKAMGASIGASKGNLSTRAFQQVPRGLRRRTASHNVKRVPKRLRARAAKEMRDDNTPTVTMRRRNPTPHQRLRLEKAKEFRKAGGFAKKKHGSSKPGETDPQKMVAIGLRIPKVKQDTLTTKAKPPAKFRKRQIHKSWLPTHLYHAKRAHMTPPKEPLWRFAIPLTPTEKCYRTTHRAATLRGCVAWDMSYMATIGVQGAEGSLLGLLRSIGVDENVLSGKREAKWRRGTRFWEGWIRERDGEKRWIAKVGIMWCLDATSVVASVTDDSSTGAQGNLRLDWEQGTNNQQGSDVVHEQVEKLVPLKTTRKLFLRVHPSAFLQTWNEVLKVAKMQRPALMVEDLRFEIGSIEVIGPESTEALVGVLQEAKTPAVAKETAAVENSEKEWVDCDTPGWIWPQLAEITNPASLPADCTLGFNISDPRLHHPPSTSKQPDLKTGDNSLLELISSWPPDQTHVAIDIFDRTKRFTASRQLASQKAINRRKGEALPGAYPAYSSKDPKIPILLTASRTASDAGQGCWTLLLPWDCVLPVWYSLMHYPLSSGGNPRFGGLQERRQIAFEQGLPWYPADYPGTAAGFQWEQSEREKGKREWEKRPKGKRIAWESVDLGEGRKGEIGCGWACDWEHLFQPLSLPRKDVEDGVISTQSTKDTKDTNFGRTNSAENSRSQASSTQPPTTDSNSPLAIHHLHAPRFRAQPFPDKALAPIHLNLLTAGHASRNARIYRLPTTNGNLRAKWLTLAHSFKNPTRSRSLRAPRPAPRSSKHADPHQLAQGLAASLFDSSAPHTNASNGTPKAGDSSYPCVPDEVDLVGFVTTGNYHLGNGKCEAIGNIAVAKTVGVDANKNKGSEKQLLIVREAGQRIGRLARWKFAEGMQ